MDNSQIKITSQNQRFTAQYISHNLSQILPNSNFRLLCSGFGNGLAVASCLLDFINVWCSEVRTYNNENRVERSEYIKYWVKKIKEK